MTRCHFCNAPSISNFELTSLDGHVWQWDLCLDCVLICQGQGYDVKAKKKKKVEQNEERKEKESEKAI